MKTKTKIEKKDAPSGEEVPVTIAPSRDKRQCANPACNKDTTKITPVFGIHGSSDIYCSRECRATKTGETVKVVGAAPAPAPAPATKAKGKPEAAAKPAPVTKANAIPPKPKAEGQRAPRATSAPWSNLEGKLHLLPTDRTFSGNRKAVWELMKDGMTVKELYALTAKANLDGKGALAKIIGVFHCAEVV